MISSLIERLANGMVICGGILFGGSLILENCTFTVNPGERGLVNEKYLEISKEKIFGPGIHFLLPYFQEPIIYDTKVQTKSVASHFATKDGFTTQIVCKVLYKPIEEMLPSLHKNYGQEYSSSLLPAVVTHVLDGYISGTEGLTLFARRHQIRERMLEEISHKSAEFGINVEDFVIMNLNLEKEALVEEKKGKGQKGKK